MALQDDRVSRFLNLNSINLIATSFC